MRRIAPAAAAGWIKRRYHALQRARQRGISRHQAKDVIRNGGMIEEHPGAEPFPKCLLMAEVQPGKPLYVALAYDEAEDYLYIVGRATQKWRGVKNFKESRKIRAYPYCRPLGEPRRARPAAGCLGRRGFVHFVRSGKLPSGSF